MPEPTEDKSTYHEEMRRWMTKQSFWHRMKYGRHPGDRSRLFMFVMKASLLILLVLGVVVGGFYLAVKNRVGSAGFAKDFGSVASEELGARGMRGSAVDWSGGVARLRKLSIHGGRSNFFSTLDAELISFPLKFADVMRGEWKVAAIEGRGVDVKLRSGAFTDREWQELLRDDVFNGEIADRGWITPQINLGLLKELVIRDVDIEWGARAWMAGSFIGCDLSATKRDGVWIVEIEKGKFSLNWIKDAEIEKMVLEIDSSVIRVVESRMRMPSGGLVRVSGTISCEGSDPEFDLAVRIDDFRLKDVVAEKKAVVLAGQFTAEVRITGSVNRQEGLISKGRLTAEPPQEEVAGNASKDRPWLVKFGRNADSELPLFTAFADSFGADGIRYFTSERSVIDFTTSMGNLEVTEIMLYDPLAGQLRGAFSYEGKSKAITRGSMILAVKDSVFENNRKLREVRPLLFTQGRNGQNEFTFSLQGTIDDLTQRDAQRVRQVAATLDE